VQGLLAGKPVVSFDIDGAKEVVIPNETGFLVPFGETDQLTESLITLVEDRLLGERLGQVGRQRFTDIFRHQTMTRGIRDEYFNLLAGKE
jgi:glycosyltransferase involved in cell wall biosynthesis